MPVLFDIGSLIAFKPGVNGGRPCIAGTGTSVRCIAVYDMQGYSPEQIVEHKAPPHVGTGPCRSGLLLGE